MKEIIEKIIDKIKCWLCGKFVERHLKVLQIEKVISPSVLAHTGDPEMVIEQEVEEMMSYLVKTLIKNGIGKITRTTDDRVGGERIRVSLKCWGIEEGTK